MAPLKVGITTLVGGVDCGNRIGVSAICGKLSGNSGRTTDSSAEAAMVNRALTPLESPDEAARRVYRVAARPRPDHTIPGPAQVPPPPNDGGHRRRR
jgi:hypothetical protein